MGSAIVHESNLQIIRDSEGPVDQRAKDERTAQRRAKIQERRSQLLVSVQGARGDGGVLGTVLFAPQTCTALHGQVMKHIHAPYCPDMFYMFSCKVAREDGSKGQCCRQDSRHDYSASAQENVHCWHMEWMGGGRDVLERSRELLQLSSDGGRLDGSFPSLLGSVWQFVPPCGRCPAEVPARRSSGSGT